MGTLAVGIIVFGAVALVIRSMVRDRKKGKSLHCGGDCGHCGGHPLPHEASFRPPH